PRHHTFFEMLGNFSFGDYFKEEAIRSAWELVTGVWGLPPERLFATVFRDDDEAWELWRRISGLPEGRILRCGEKDNFWAMGDVGPCGPCSEIHVDLAPDEPEVGWEEGSESGRFLELWNLVFMQYDRDEAGELTPLPNPSIDTGAGLERLAAVLQGVASNYDSDLFLPILEAAGELAGVAYRPFQGPELDRPEDVSLRVIADHLRAVAFLLADGVIPGNEGRGYVLRRILRRAVRHGMRLGREEPFLHRLVPVVGEAMAGAYPELAATREASVATVRAEEEKFLSTLAAGARQVQEEIEAARARGLDRLPGERAFWLYETHGLPLEVIREIAEEERMGLDDTAFEEALRAQQARSRQASGEGKKRVAELARSLRGEEAGETAFAGYRNLELAGAKVLRLAAERDGRPVPAASIGPGEEGVAVLDRTVFYAESGGQVGDRGTLSWPGGRARVTDVQKDSTGVYFHALRVEEGSLRQGQEVTLAVAPEHRLPTQRNHTATHLLHAALREVLGTGVRQAGSLVAPDRLRFDFTFHRPLTPEELRRVEDRVNEWVLRAAPTRIEERAYREAVAAGAMALFGEKYGDVVRTVEVPGVSLELCGGCHVANTGEIGLFLVTAERGIASGVRRLEAVTGEAALARVREREELLAAAADALGSPPERAAEEAGALRAALAERERELAKLRLDLVAGRSGGAAADEAVEVDGIRVLAREVPPAPAGELRNMADALRSKVGSGVVVLGARDGGKVSLIAAVTPDLTARIQAGRLVQELAALVGGSGGGRPDFAQAGGREPERLPAALAAAAEKVRELLS
ncbi:MAG TPA: alanine--tRNA ligase, partial [Thermoanaerobaculia bacterium]|nr:alanine--tRNA ligase [Thermoanaerobaculia bacterium]